MKHFLLLQKMLLCCQHNLEVEIKKKTTANSKNLYERREGKTNVIFMHNSRSSTLQTILNKPLEVMDNGNSN